MYICCSFPFPLSCFFLNFLFRSETEYFFLFLNVRAAVFIDSTDKNARSEGDRKLFINTIQSNYHRLIRGASVKGR